MKFSAVVNTLYVLAGVALFATGEAPVVSAGVDFYADKFSVAWAGWKFSGCLYMALVNGGVHLGLASAVAMIPYIAFDVYATQDPTHWTPLAYSFIALEAATAVTALMGNLKVGGVINALYVLAGVALFATGEAPVVTAGVDFLGNKFAMAWAGCVLSPSPSLSHQRWPHSRVLHLTECIIVLLRFDCALLSAAGNSPVACTLRWSTSGITMAWRWPSRWCLTLPSISSRSTTRRTGRASPPPSSFSMGRWGLSVCRTTSRPKTRPRRRERKRIGIRVR
jgi:hypothetical protein